MVIETASQVAPKQTQQQKKQVADSLHLDSIHKMHLDIQNELRKAIKAKRK